MAFFSWKTAVAISLLHGSALAVADPVPPLAGARTTAPSAVPMASTPSAASGAAAQDPGPDIAPPAPDAPAKKVEDAEAVAKSAQLTPIIPNPRDATKPAFQLYAEIDPPIVAVGAVFALAHLTKTQPAFCAPACDSVKLNALDKVTAGYYSAGWSRASDYLLYGLGAASAALLISDEGLLDTLNDGVVIGEATISATAVASIMTLAAGRPRPFLYGDPAFPDGYKAPLSVRNSADAGLSFLSNHTAMAFAVATSLYVTEHRLHPRSNYPKVILGVGLGVASTIAVARVMSGYHFVSDVLGGALVGSSAGVLVASIHGSPVHLVPVVNSAPEGSGAGLALGGAF